MSLWECKLVVKLFKCKHIKGNAAMFYQNRVSDFEVAPCTDITNTCNCAVYHRALVMSAKRKGID